MTKYTPEGIIRNGISKAVEDVMVAIIIPVFLTIFKEITNSFPSSKPNGMDFFILIFYIILILPYIAVFIAFLTIENPLKIISYAVYVFVFSWLSYVLGDYISIAAMIFVVLLAIIIRIKTSNNDNQYRYWV